MNRIKSITVVNQQGTAFYSLGGKVDGIMIDRIEDESIEYESGINFIYMCYSNDKLVVELINLPVDIHYLVDGNVGERERQWRWSK